VPQKVELVSSFGLKLIFDKTSMLKYMNFYQEEIIFHRQNSSAYLQPNIIVLKYWRNQHINANA